MVPDESVKIQADLDVSKLMQTLANMIPRMHEMIQQKGKTSKSLLGTMLTGDAKRDTSKLFGDSMGGAFKNIATLVGAIDKDPAVRKGLGKNFFDGAKKSVGEFKKELSMVTSEFSKMEKAVNQAGRGPLMRTLAALRPTEVKSGAGRILGGAGRLGLRAAGLLGQGVAGFLTGVYTQASRAYEQTAGARLSGAPYMLQMSGYGPQGANYKPGRYPYARGGETSKWGYNVAEAATLQAGAARMGIAGPGTAGSIMQMARGMGEEALQYGGGFMRQRNLRGEGGAKSMMKEMSAAVAIGVQTGLGEERIGELLQGQLEYAEKQVAMTPDKNQWEEFMREIGRIQEMGGGGMKGRYAVAGLGRADEAIKGAQGVQQAFLLRAFGFGGGTSFFDALKRQETGAVGRGKDGQLNIMSVMKQLRSEYGSGKGGGLSEAGMLAFRGMGMGSLHMAQKFSDIYLKVQKGKMTSTEAEKKVQQIEQKEKEAKMPAIQRKAYQAMSSFGGVAKLLSGKFNILSEVFGPKAMHIKTAIIDAQMKIIKSIKTEGITKLVNNLADIATKIMPKMLGLLDKIFLGINMIVSVFKAIGKHGLKFWKFSGEIQKEFTEYDNMVRKKRAEDDNEGRNKFMNEESKRGGLASKFRTEMRTLDTNQLKDELQVQQFALKELGKFLMAYRNGEVGKNEEIIRALKAERSTLLQIKVINDLIRRRKIKVVDTKKRQI